MDYNLEKKLDELKDRVDYIKQVLHFSEKEIKYQELNSLMSQSDFWNDKEGAVKISQHAESLKSEIEMFLFFVEEIKELKDLISLQKEYQDLNTELEIEKRFNILEKKFSDLEFLLLFSDSYDDGNAIISIHAGAGGVDACDWAQMLERMYLRFAEKKGFKVEPACRKAWA